MLIISLVFLAVFLLVIAVAFHLHSEPAAQRKITATRLAAISANAISKQADAQVDEVLRDQKFSSTPWLNTQLLKVDTLERVRLLLLQTDSKWSVGQLLAYSVLAAAGGFFLAYSRTRQVPAGILFGGIAIFAPFARVLHLRARRMAKFEKRLPEALEMMVSSIRAGHSLLSALGTVAKESPAPLCTEFRKCFDEQNFGMDLRTAMQNLAVRVPLHDVQIVVTAILIQRESGGNLAEILERVAHVIRQRFRLKNQIRTHTAQGRLTGWILAFLPVVLGCAIYLVNPEYISRLWQNPLGTKLLYASAVMTVTGALIIRKIVNVRM
ncbi:MAG TPA: type II secretion system F family protein [Bryobacteraceae bacterium]|nr:type II secretion system F family protein [Bryobacteraceae bacterium]